jgi:hypothetical protein
MKFIGYYTRIMTLALLAMVVTSCHDLLDEAPEKTSFVSDTDYTQSQNMIQPLIGAYAEFYARGWEDFPLISVRGDDVNAGGLGDQQDYAETDVYNYNRDYWMYNSVWQNHYNDIWTAHSTMEQIQLYREAGANSTLADQYIAEAKVIRAFLLFQLSRVWGDVFVPTSSDPSDLLVMPLTKKDDVMAHIVAQMDEAIPHLPNVHPNQRTDIKGGVTRYTALAIKALAALEKKDYQTVADATSAIIASGLFELEDDYYNLFKIPGKLNKENILEWQYSDFGQGAGDNKSYLFAFFGPQTWQPKVSGANAGWGFYEPSLKYIKFMIDRGERKRLETSVLFTNRGIEEIKKDPNYATIPDWISNTTPSGDVIPDYARAMFASGKHYLPSDQLTPGRVDYGTNKNFICIRYAEILLMHAEALVQGATGTGKTADQAVNEVRSRAGLGSISGVTLDDVMNEKYAELAMEWGTRYYDMIRLGKFNELNYDGRTFSDSKIFLPYPQAQVDLYPILRDNQ